MSDPVPHNLTRIFTAIAHIPDRHTPSWSADRTCLVRKSPETGVQPIASAICPDIE